LAASSHLLLVDAFGGPQAEELAVSLADIGVVRTITLWKPGGNDRRIHALRRLSPVDTVARPDHVIEAGLALAANHDVRGVVSYSEDVSFYAGVLANLLGLPANPADALIAVRRKEIQRARVVAAGLASPRLRLVRSADDLAACAELRFPVILKPATGVSSFCVLRVADPADLPAAYAASKKRYEDHPVSNEMVGLFLVEEEIVGCRWHTDQRLDHRVSVESLLHGGGVCYSEITDKLPLVEPFREQGHLTPTTLGSEDAARVRTVAEQAVRALGLTTGAVHTELILTEGEPVIVEVNGRIGGSVYGLLKYSRGYDMALAIAQTALGRRPEQPGPVRRRAAMIRPQSPVGRFRVAGVDDAIVSKAIALADWGQADKALEDLVDSGIGSTAALARYLVTAETVDGLFARADEITPLVHQAFQLQPA
jgi:biotin carboxylase